jgi:membrane-bound lytic murein transglycosylase D
MKKSSKRNHRFITAACLVLLTGGVIASYSIQSEDPAGAPLSSEPPPAEAFQAESPVLEALYRQLAENSRLYEEGIEQISRADRARGEQKTAEAQDQLFTGARRCATVQGCEISLFFNAITDLLELRKSALIEDATGASGPASEIPNGEEHSTASVSSESAPFPPAENRTLRGQSLEELIELNEPVKAALNDWLTSMRPLLMNSYENYQYLRDQIAPIYKEAGLPEALLFALIATETGGKVHAVSNAGAAGLMQFMRQTGKRYGLVVEDGFDLRFDPAASTRANVAYLNEQLEILNQNLEKTLAAYNGGENRLQRLNRKFKGIDFWDSRFYNSLPGETRIYVPRILAAAWLFLHPADYNLRFPSMQTQTSQLTVRKDTALDQLCICLGQAQGQRDGWFRTLRNLNPRLEPDDRIQAGEVIEIPTILKGDYERNCVEGHLPELARELHEAKSPEQILYTVAPGDSLQKIALRYRCTSAADIALANDLRAPEYVIRSGQLLKIPGCR